MKPIDWHWIQCFAERLHALRPDLHEHTVATIGLITFEVNAAHGARRAAEDYAACRPPSLPAVVPREPREASFRGALQGRYCTAPSSNF